MVQVVRISFCLARRPLAHNRRRKAIPSPSRGRRPSATSIINRCSRTMPGGPPCSKGSDQPVNALKCFQRAVVRATSFFSRGALSTCCWCTLEPCSRYQARARSSVTTSPMVGARYSAKPSTALS